MCDWPLGLALGASHRETQKQQLTPTQQGNLAQGPVGTCDKNDKPLNDGGNTKSGCDSGGNAFMCSSQSPWAVNETTAYGYAAVRISGSNENSWCCACYELTFTSAPLQGKKLIVQATNTGGDLGSNHFDLAVRVPPFLSWDSSSFVSGDRSRLRGELRS